MFQVDTRTLLQGERYDYLHDRNCLRKAVKPSILGGWDTILASP